jgi:bifunctional NMN adenylyltransferase/nudix hydrolase
MSAGLIVARLQVYELENAHAKMIERIMQKHEKALFVLRVSRLPATKVNPLDAGTRKAMLHKIFPQLEVLTLDDQPLNELWSKKLDELAEKHFGKDVVLYGDARDLGDYKGKYPVETLSEIQGKTVESVHISEGEKATVLFRKGVFDAVQRQYSKVYPTVDIAIKRDGKILLAKKPGVSGYRFIGGFSDPSDESYEAAAAREVEEETGIIVKNVSYLGSTRVDDWRYRSEQDKIITLFFTAEYVSGDAAAKDDISEIKWFAPADMNEEMMVQEHRPLLKLLKEKL